MHKGTLIVIDGTDGSGKATHAALLLDRFSREGRDAVLADFPQYGKPSAYFVEKYLRGEYGTADAVGAYRASTFYALDRYDASFAIRNWLKEGKIIVSNRYVSSNMGHQAGKISDQGERARFLSWLKEFEYGLLEIPKPDVNILLYVPPEIGQELVDRKGERAYTHGKKRDIHEADIEHLRHASAAYLAVAKDEGWTVIHCVDENTKALRSIEEIHEELYQHLLARGAI